MAGAVPLERIVNAASPEEISIVLIEMGGPLLPLSTVWSLLGYPSPEAARKSAKRDRAPLPLQDVPGRRGKYVRSTDLAAWLFENTKHPDLRSAVASAAPSPRISAIGTR
jgi:hypothetical protein